MTNIFISYSQGDGMDFVQWLTSYLDSLPDGSFHSWYDRRLTPAIGSGLSQEIEREIQKADYFLVVLTKNVEKEESYVHKEISYAQQLPKTIIKSIIPLLLEDCIIPLSIANLQYVDFRRDRSTAVSELVLYLKGAPLPPKNLDSAIQPAYHKYLSRLVQRLGLLPLQTIDLALKPEVHLKLAQLWVPLYTTTLDAESIPFPNRAFVEPAHPISVVDMVARHKHLILMGDPGSGKSTATRFIALALAGAELHDPDLVPLDLENLGPQWQRGKLCPIYLEIREFAAKTPSQSPLKADDLFNYIVRDVESSNITKDFAPQLKRDLNTGQCFILLDGVDEVTTADERRNHVLQCIRDFNAQFSQCPIIVTTRTYAYRRHDWLFDGFVETEIAPLAEEQINDYIDRWYTTIKKFYPQLAGREHALKQEIAAYPQDLGFLAQRPLLLALMTSLHSRSRDALPNNRAKLYHAITELLLIQWEKSKIVVDPQTGQTQYTQSPLAEFLGSTSVDRPEELLRDVLNKVAFQAQQGMKPSNLIGTEDIALKDLAHMLYKAFHEHQQSSANLPREYDIANEIKDRSGILLAYDEDIYRFPHRSFQEYLAACDLLTDDNFPHKFQECVHHDPERWREVVSFAIGEVLESRKRTLYVWDLIEVLVPNLPSLESLPSPDDIPWSVALCAGLALAVNSVPKPTSSQQTGRPLAIYERVQKWLENLITSGALTPRDRFLAGQSLAKMGDSRPGVSIGAFSLPDIAWSNILTPKTVRFFADKQEYFVAIQPYQIACYPITHQQYQSFIEAPDGWMNARWWDFSPEANIWHTNNPQPQKPDWTEENCPRTTVNWFEAIAFCQWLSDRLQMTIRLPTEVEWEYAARDAQGHLYPWGEVFETDRANIRVSSNEEGGYNLNRISPVGMYPLGKSIHGLFDTIGNVWEWCQTEYRALPYRPGDGREDLQGNQPRVVRGGSWQTPLAAATISSRGEFLSSSRRNDCGFRICLPCP